MCSGNPERFTDSRRLLLALTCAPERFGKRTCRGAEPMIIAVRCAQDSGLGRRFAMTSRCALRRRACRRYDAKLVGADLARRNRVCCQVLFEKRKEHRGALRPSAASS